MMLIEREPENWGVLAQIVLVLSVLRLGIKKLLGNFQQRGGCVCNRQNSNKTLSELTVDPESALIA